jgi:hypothetical protein
MSWVGFAFLLMSILGIHTSQWPLLLAPTQGSLPNDQAQYQAFIRYVRRQGHLTDKGVDSVKNMNFYSGPEQQVETFTVMPAIASHDQPSYNWPEQHYNWTEPESQTQSEISSCNSGETEPDISDLFGLPYNVAGEQLYLGYRHAKRRWRKFTGGAKRRFGKGRHRRFGKGKFGKGSGGKFGFGKGNKGKGKGKGKSYFSDPFTDWSQFALESHDGDHEHTYWLDDYSDWSENSWGQADGIVYLGKGKFKRGNPICKDGKQLECSLCGSTEHFCAKCPKNKTGMTHAQAQAQSGRTFATAQSSQVSSASAAASSESTGWGSDWGSRIYFARPTAKPIEHSYSVIELSDGTEVVLEESDRLQSIAEEVDDSPLKPLLNRTYYHPPDEQHHKQAQLSRHNQSDPFSAIARQFAFMWFMPSAFHAQVRIAGGGPALLIDPGAYDNLVGDEWVQEATQLAVKAGHGCAWQKMKNQLSVEGVGKECNTATQSVIIPICFENGDTGTFTSPVIEQSKLPALLGLQSLTNRRALIDVFNRQIVFVGPGGYRLQTSPGSKTYKLYPAKTGHLMLPCQCWKDAKISPGNPGTVL